MPLRAHIKFGHTVADRRAYFNTLSMMKSADNSLSFLNLSPTGAKK